MEAYQKVGVYLAATKSITKVKIFLIYLSLVSLLKKADKLG